jgi:hypothetical protein
MEVKKFIYLFHILKSGNIFILILKKIEFLIDTSSLFINDW